MSSDLERWWKDLPVLTKYLFVGSFGVTLAANFGLLSPYSLVLIWPKVITEFQLWRLVTCFLFHGKLGFPFLIHMLFLYALFATHFVCTSCAKSFIMACRVRYASSLESEIFNGRLSDYVWMQVITCSLLLVRLSTPRCTPAPAPSVPSCTAAASL
jgi:hypothetical protein